MTKNEFMDGLNKLCLFFEKKLKSELAAAMFERFCNYRNSDWNNAVDQLCEDPEQRTFPRLGQMLKVIYRVIEDRIEREADEQKARERKEIEAIMSSPQGETIMDENKKKLRRLIEAMGKGKEAVDELGREFAKDAAKDIASRNCLCNDGLVHYSKQVGTYNGEPLIYSYVAACSRCKQGKVQPRSYRRIDPVDYQIEN